MPVMNKAHISIRKDWVFGNITSYIVVHCTFSLSGTVVLKARCCGLEYTNDISQLMYPCSAADFELSADALQNAAPTPVAAPATANATLVVNFPAQEIGT